jgi:hypothetical protein
MSLLVTLNALRLLRSGRDEPIAAHPPGEVTCSDGCGITSH